MDAGGVLSETTGIVNIQLREPWGLRNNRQLTVDPGFRNKACIVNHDRYTANVLSQGPPLPIPNLGQIVHFDFCLWSEKKLEIELAEYVVRGLSLLHPHGSCNCESRHTWIAAP